ncbi:carboxypeptidase-like regulatory domain-containing protein [Pyxidicoccus xibeiensis]|uniref:carboxypeptidase-like regulatory domain-containing protein n=1 Tax=Pyxidicoccus xibeiensis TaxID=2906759 RepID=UPI0020A74EEC|nr:carboxypeptidase-like regulatory domain-containing protein [Pyxidicoccus xibeiensis]MCP3141756.1 carboxypeptidase-like regulatory domain-containing protein [Pyxidicoccus xibeiensis]
MKTLLRGPLLCALLLSTASAAADSTATFIGTVTEDASGKPLADVVVTATAPTLEHEQTVVTDAQGNYRIPGLPQGVYTLRFEREGFELHARQDLKLRLPRTVRADMAMSAVGQPSAIAVGSPSPGINSVSVDPEFIKRIAVARPGGRARADTHCFGCGGPSIQEQTPAWMLSRMPIVVPDGTPQLVYRAPSADRCSPDFGSR